MEYLIFAAAMVCFIVLMMLKSFLDYKKSEKRFVQKLYKEYGTLPQKEYKPEQFENISHYFLKHKEGYYVDDITWNDLNMDEIFKQLNNTFSSAGEEYLYHILRTPCLEEEELLKREGIISWFQNHSDERVSYQFIFSRLGKCGKFSIYDYLDYLDQLGERSNLKHYLAIAGILGSILLLFVNIPIGLVALVCILIYNNLSYFKIKNKIDPYITSFAYVFRLLDAVGELVKKRVAILEEEFDELITCHNAMTGFRTGSSLVMSGSRMSGSGNPLEILADFLRMGFHIDLIKFNQMLTEVRKHLPEIDRMISVLGKIEAMIAIGSYRKAMSCCVPEFTDELFIETNEMYHPLITHPVKNDISTGSSVLITGSNASGKSTFLKTVAISAILAQTIHTCPAASYKASLFRICSSMSLRDDVQGGDSYYMVEIKSLKRILAMAADEGDNPVLCFVDEVLRGTNTVERIAASTEILRSLDKKNCICFAATHDIELTHLLTKNYDNYHFEEDIADNDISFSYKIMCGRATTRNAIRLLGIMGYDKQIIEEAEQMANHFMKTGQWHGLDEQKPE
ncbi:MAG: hypothetical protein KIH00_04785 [Lachnospiraceae bacterium]|nr:hypothetical protein [Lachnospiraceae bacterium]MDY5869727.1 hypothetical protein [Lachnospiraceae bacterium]